MTRLNRTDPRRMFILLVGGLLGLAAPAMAQPGGAQVVDPSALPPPAKAGSPEPAVPAAAFGGPTAAAPAAPAERQAKIDQAQQRAEAALATPEPQPAEPPSTESSRLMAEIPRMNLFELAVAGGPVMIPIAFFSVLVVALTLERAIALRRGNVLPRGLVQGLRALAGNERGVDPRQVYRLCQKCPSSASTVIRAMLMKVGRPAAEMTQAAQETAQREADRLNGNVRWLTLSAAVAPMLGLLGTVQGMILAFFIVSHLPAGANKAQVLAESIYIALITTFGGLVVAIPAAIAAHWFSGRILRLLREIEELAHLLQVHVERYERRQRAGAEQAAAGDDDARPAPAEESRVKPPTPSRK